MAAANDYSPNGADPTGTKNAAPRTNYDPFANLTANPFSGFQTITANLTRPTFWERIGVGMLGLLFIWWAILFALASNKTVQKVAKTALKSNPATAAPAAIVESAIGS